MPDSVEPNSRMTPAGLSRGARKTLVIAVLTLPFGIAFGVAAREAGLDGLTALAMSATTFAGASQFAALEIWQAKVPLLPLVFVVLAVNARLVLMGAVLAGWLRPLAWRQRLAAILLLSDPNFALTTAARASGERDVGFLLGSGLMLWCAWLIGTGTGLALSTTIGDPADYGLDVMLPAFFTALLVGLWQGGRDALPWLVAAGTALLAASLLPGQWHIVIGGLAGGLTGALRHAA